MQLDQVFRAHEEDNLAITPMDEIVELHFLKHCAARFHGTKHGNGKALESCTRLLNQRSEKASPQKGYAKLACWRSVEEAARRPSGAFVV